MGTGQKGQAQDGDGYHRMEGMDVGWRARAQDRGSYCGMEVTVMLEVTSIGQRGQVWG